ncbi:DNA methyltransferase [Candidatus Margulisiibacteriota bacterium]
MTKKCDELLNSIFKIAKKAKLNEVKGLSGNEKDMLNTIVNKSTSQTGVYTVLITSLVTKIINPKQDTRCHQANMPGGYSGRSFDTAHITPFLKSIGFPFMKESGWLTRSLEQNYPYKLNYRGRISNKEVKAAFLSLLDNIEEKKKDPYQYLLHIFILSIMKMQNEKISTLSPIKKDSRLTIDCIIEILMLHFSWPYKERGASRLPVLAISAIYKCLLSETKRYSGKLLIALEEHTSPDSRSGAIADINIKTKSGDFYEAVEVKHNIHINPQMILDAYNKLKSHKVERYYILTTASPSILNEDEKAVNEGIDKIRKEHGCQVIANGILPTIRFYLRLLGNTDNFINNYADNLTKDRSIQFEHKEAWNQIYKTMLQG